MNVKNDFERWIYILKQMIHLIECLSKARKAVFERLEKVSLQSEYDRGGKNAVKTPRRWKYYNDYFNTSDFAEQKGIQKVYE